MEMNRRSFVKRAGVAVSGAAALGVVGAPLASAEPQAMETTPSGRVPAEPVVAYVRDAKRGEVTVVSGTSEKTFRDPALVKRMVKAGDASKKVI
jgi:hypothetical protein